MQWKSSETSNKKNEEQGLGPGKVFQNRGNGKCKCNVQRPKGRNVSGSSRRSTEAGEAGAERKQVGEELGQKLGPGSAEGLPAF